MLTNKLKAILGQILFAANVFVLFIVLAESKIIIPDWLHVFGRMHPLLLHFPIVIILLAIVLVGFPDLLPKKEDSTLYGKDFLLLGAFTAGFTVIAGLLLSHETGYDKEALFWHKWTSLGIFWLSSLLYYFIDRQSPLAIKISATFLGLIVIVSGHLGASITHGDNFITAPLENKETQMVSLEEAEVFAHVVYPIIENKCLSCHKASKQKGELRMDSPEHLFKGGESGPAVEPFDSENSLLTQRINLPEEDEDHMPPEGKPQLTEEEKAILEAWIGSGAITDQKVLALADTSSIYPLAIKKFESAPKVYAFDPVSDDILEPLNNFYRKIQPLGITSPALSVSYFGRANFDPESLKELAPIQEQTVSINLNSMPIKDEHLASLGSFPNLEKLYLNFTDITGPGLQSLVGLENLTLLSLSGNNLTEEAIAPLSQLKNVKKLFLWNTGLTEESLEKLIAALPHTTIEIGTEERTTLLMLNPPVISFDKAFFKDKLKVELTHPIGTTSIYYTLDGTEPDSSNFLLYEKPLEITENASIKARAFAEGWIGSKVSEAEFISATLSPASFEMNYAPEDRYKGDGKNSLFDKKKAIPDSWNLNWLGFINSPLEVEMEFEQPTDISYMAISLWQNIGARFFPPQEVKIWTRPDKNQDWKLSKSFRPQPLSKDDDSYLRQVEIPFAEKNVQYLKMEAKPLAKLPSWHGAAENKAWLMVDEIVLN
ncbi:c-type cytochrome domain-containing protein [Cyclobacterium sp. 1_MG-2023]|uniref:c-type cytochrome domain-containing protein n=1 Tax=Cyclobacterium sp. 1_MG-2023 TaxID=3062681 RepID=UPI0026E34FC5|nr:c-type cytochrome domain-containing protein [Cyclobacterium sp. 1_MG-2023]MDO6437598.1 c-type cytochrome domain-containing protein [Cyclobacterium sp. 1_MG-2023]